MSYDDVLMTLKGKVSGMPLISLWRHYPGIDLELDKLVDITIKDYNKYPSDLVKLSPHARYCTVDFGCKIIPGNNDHGGAGASSCSSCIVKSPKHWKNVKEIDPLEGHYGETIKFVESVSKLLPDVPKMMTVFSPTMVARKLSQNQFPNHLVQADNTAVKEAFEIVSKVTIEFARACIDAGANGIFIATQEADKDIIPDIQLSKTLLKMNTSFNVAINNRAEFTVMHIHGDDAHYNEILDILPSTAINWHDQASGFTIEDAAAQFKGGLLAGIEPTNLLKGITTQEIKDLRKLTEELPYILAPGCVLLQGTENRYLDLIFKNYKD